MGEDLGGGGALGAKGGEAEGLVAFGEALAGGVDEEGGVGVGRCR